MQLTYLYAPVADLEAALPFYRDTLGLEEAWREGTDTVAFALPDKTAQIMVSESTDPAGPMYLVPSVDAFLSAHPDVTVFQRQPVPGGEVVGFRDPSGNALYVFDQVG